ncbi:MAG: hypothetical protein L3K14_04940 [Thermoplasmata archaeon]|nr:hypothetical protein [Thermoplasmata archaeon]
MVTCLIQNTSATITFDDGAEITIPRKYSEPPEKTVTAVANLLQVGRFQYALSPVLVSDGSDRHQTFVEFLPLLV